MPAATESPAASKKEREELLWQALQEHIMLERQKKKEGENRISVLAKSNKKKKKEIVFLFMILMFSMCRTRS